MVPEKWTGLQVLLVVLTRTKISNYVQWSRRTTHRKNPNQMTTRITLEEPRAAAYPVVKRTALGQTFNGAILKAESRDRLRRADDGSMVPIIKPNGNHSQELVVTCLTLPGTTTTAGLGDQESIPEPGAIVRLILKGKAFGDWIDAKKSLPDGAVAVGDVVTQVTASAQVYDATGNPSGVEITDQTLVDQARAKGRSIGIYGPLTLRAPKDGSEWTEKAVAAYKSLQTPIPAEAPSNDFDEYTPTAASPSLKPAKIPQAEWDKLDEATRAVIAKTLFSDEPPF
jgi:hypothetical protein